jgi:hypothetical protein
MNLYFDVCSIGGLFLSTNLAPNDKNKIRGANAAGMCSGVLLHECIQGVCGRIRRVWGVCVSFISFHFPLHDSYSGSSGFLFHTKVRSLIRMLSNAYEFHFYTFLLLDVTVPYEPSLFFADASILLAASRCTSRCHCALRTIFVLC